MKYYVYRDSESNKVGCTSAPEKRMQEQQGLEPFKDYVIFESECKTEASHMEAYYKGLHNVEWDNDIYMSGSIEKPEIYKNAEWNNYTISNHTQHPDEFTISSFLKFISEKGVIFKEGDDKMEFEANQSEEVMKAVQKSFYKPKYGPGPGGVYATGRAIRNLYKKIKNA